MKITENVKFCKFAKYSKKQCFQPNAASERHKSVCGTQIALNKADALSFFPICVRSMEGGKTKRDESYSENFIYIGDGRRADPGSLGPKGRQKAAA
jgi:hypothetical protein